MSAVFSTLIYILGPLVVGYGTQVGLGRWSRSALHVVHREVGRIKKGLVLFLQPVVQLLAFWAFDFQDLGLLPLPLLGASSLIVGGGVGLFMGRRLNLPIEQRGSLFLTSMMSNLFSFGGLVSFLLYGESGFAIALLYRAFEPLIYAGVAYPLGAFLAGGAPPSLKAFARALFTQPVALLPMIGIALGLLLQFAGVPRPELISTINSNLIVASAFILIFSIGLSLKPARVLEYKAACGIVSAVKFAVTPVWVAVACLMLGYGSGSVDDAPVLQVALIMSAMPAAMTSIIPTALFGFDEDLTGSAWLVTTLVSMPVILLLAWMTNG